MVLHSSRWGAWYGTTTSWGARWAAVATELVQAIDLQHGRPVVLRISYLSAPDDRDAVLAEGRALLRSGRAEPERGIEPLTYALRVRRSAV